MRFYVDDIAYFIENKDDETILNILKYLGYIVPSFCVHNQLEIAGNCRMCLVQVNNDLVVSCAVNIMPDMLIFTKTKRVFHARDSVLEFLLVNHPLDCPICDQGGSCDLQDLTFLFGSDRGRFYEIKKRSVDNLNSCGPLIKTIMTRCIHCTRCVRFLNFFGVNDLGVIGRGQNMEIGSYINKLILIEDQLSANIIDLCPVGALTSMPYAFTARSWELKNIESIDILDSLASAIRIDIFNNKVMRILPLLDHNVNEEWITNKVRFIYDSFSMHRISFPKLKLHNSLIIISWFKAFTIFLQILFFSGKKFVKVFIGPFCDLESALSLKLFFNNIGCSNITYYNNLYYNVDFRVSFLLNNSLINLENLLFIILLGTNLRMELPLLNSRIRKSWINSNYTLNVYSFGLSLDYLTYPVINISNNIFSLFLFFQNKHSLILKIFNNKANYFNLLLFNYPYFFIGLSILNRLDSNQFLYALQNYVNNYLLNLSIISIISPFLGRLSSLEFNLNKKINKSVKNTFVYLSNIFDYKHLNLNIMENSSNFIVFSGSFKDYFFFNSNLIFPIPIFTETSYSFLNIEGRLRYSQVAISLQNKIYTEYQIFRYLYILSNLKFYNNILVLNFKKLLIFFEHIINYKCIFFTNNLKYKTILLHYLGLSENNLLLSNFNIFIFYSQFMHYKFISSPLYSIINNYYFTDFFSKNSKILSLCASKCIISSFSINQTIIE